jgi:hypothetical protein
VELNLTQALDHALHLEEIKLLQVIDDSTKLRDRKIQSLHAELAAKGALQSGRGWLAESEIRWDSIWSVVETIIGVRKDLGRRVPDLLRHDHLNSLERKLAQLVDGTATAANDANARLQIPAAGAALNQESATRANALRHRITTELTALELEARLGIHTPQNAALTVNISQSTIAALNLGTIVGDLTGTIHSLSNSGHQDLAEALGRVTEAVATSSEIPDSTRKNLIEHLAFVASESAAPSEHRKMGPLRASISTLQSGLTIATQLTGLWTAVEHALRAMGVVQ